MGFVTFLLIILYNYIIIYNGCAVQQFMEKIILYAFTDLKKITR